MPRGTVPTVAELEARIDEAVVIARASEEGVREVGEMALDAAKQAKRAAEMAVEAARSARPAGPVSDTSPAPTGAGPASSPPTGREVVIDPFQRFSERADAIAARLEKLVG
ncbi:MAG TPA: hypothetical protein VGK41_02820 [Solirubrobacterales bacterium]